MSEPVTVYKGGDTAVSYGPAQLAGFLASGWTTEQPAAEAKPAAPKRTTKRTTTKKAANK